ncbi:MAG: hypothetical protein U0271_19025 [Polyangiaceae bacterium]
MPRPAALGAVLLATTAACGGPQNTTTNATTSASTSASASAVVSQVVPESEAPVPPPKNLFLTARAPNAKSAFATIERMGKLSVPIQSLLDDASNNLFHYVDATQPIDLAVSLDPQNSSLDPDHLLYGVGLPLTGEYRELLDLVVKHGDEVRSMGPTSWRIHSGKAFCDLSAKPNAPPRMACGTTLAAYRELVPWMLKTLPGTVMPNQKDLSVHFDFDVIRPRVRPRMRDLANDFSDDLRRTLERGHVTDTDLLDAPDTIDKEIMAAFEAIGKNDVSLALDSAKDEATLTADLGFTTDAPWLVALVTGQNGAQRSPPPAYFHLPKDADTALFARAADPALFQGIRQVGSKAVSAMVAVAPLKQEAKDAIVRLFDSIPSSTGDAILAVGPLPLLPVSADASKPDKFTPQDAIVAAQNRARGLGWVLVGGEGDVGSLSTFVRNAEDVYDRVVAAQKEEADQRIKNTSNPDDLKWRKASRARLDKLPKVTFDKKPKGLPAGSFMADLTISFTSEDAWDTVHPDRSWDTRPKHPTGKAVKGTIVFRLVAVPDDAGRFLWGFGADPDEVRARVLSSLATSPTDQQLSTRADIKRVDQPGVAGGFIEPGLFLRRFTQLDPSDHDFRDLIRGLDSLPQLGAGVVYVRVTGQSGSTPSVHLELTFDKDWTRDLSALAILLFR